MSSFSHKIDEWMKEAEARPESAVTIVRLIARRLRELTERNAELLTENIAMQNGPSEAQIPYMIYAHLHLMDERGQLEEWLPDAASETGYDLTRSILNRTSDAWLYGRSAWDAPPYEALDELVYSTEYGYLDALIFTARPDAFTEARRAWLAENPGGIEEYRRWFVDTFNREPPGLRVESAED